MDGTRPCDNHLDGNHEIDHCTRTRIDIKRINEIVSLPFISVSEGAISTHSFSCMLNIVTCDRRVAIPSAFGLTEVFTCMGIALVTIILMEITKLIIVRVQGNK